MRFLRSFLFRLYGECFTRRGRRRLGRRLATRFLLLFVAIAWTYPFVSAFWDEQLVDFVRGRVVVSGAPDRPVLRTAVVLVPAPSDPSNPRALARYRWIDPGAPLPAVFVPKDAAVFLWTDVDGWFGGMHLALGVPYRIEVRRSGCPVVVFGVRTFRLLDFWSRRFDVEVPPCPGSC